MAERAKRASVELERRGWSLDQEYGKECRRCGLISDNEARYCSQCGTRTPGGGDALADIEAAIAAAVGGDARGEIDKEVERAAFERWFSDGNPAYRSIERKLLAADNAWRVWLARAALDGCLDDLRPGR